MFEPKTKEIFVGSMPIRLITISIEVALISRFTAPTDKRLPRLVNEMPPATTGAAALQNV
jgi:hypothetical protein